MKRLYSTMGLALSFGIALAASPAPIQKGELLKTVKDLQPVSQVVRTPGMNKKAAQMPTTLTEMYGNYQWVGVTGLSEIQYYKTGDMVFSAGDNENEVLVYGINIYSEMPITANIDLKNGTVEFPNRQLVGDYQGYNVYFMHYRWNSTGDAAEEQTTPLTGYIQDDGSIVFDFMDCMAIWVPDLGGGMLLEYANMLIPRPETLDNTGWTDAGTAKVSSMWFESLPEWYGDEIAPYDVKYQTLDEDPNFIRLVDPYGKGTPYEGFNFSIAEGEIILYIGNPDCVGIESCYNLYIGDDQETGEPVYAEAGVYSGLMSTDVAYYPSNKEGYYMFYEGFSPSEIIESGELESTSTLKDGTITIHNAVYGISFDVVAQYTDFLSENDLGTPTMILDLAGVNSLDAEDVNAPVKYYNLQGIQIANPEKGQLVIKKQGSKTVKYIAR